MDNYDSILEGFKLALDDHYNEDEDALLEQIEALENHDDVEENVRKSLKEARDAIELEDPVITEAKLILGQGQT